MLLTAAVLGLLSWSLWAQDVITFPSAKMPIGEALSVVEAQSGMSVAYNEQLTNPSKVVATPVGKTLQEALAVLLEGTGTEAVIKGKMILIVKKKSETPV